MTTTQIVRAALRALVLSLAGTGIALVPNAAPLAVRQPSRAQAAAVEAGD